MSLLSTTFVLGTRGSELALVQTEQVRTALLEALPGLNIAAQRIVTTGDSNQGVSGPIARDKADWISEIEQELLNGGITAAIHSSKDVPIDIHPSTDILPVLPRCNPFDVLVFKESTLPPNVSGVEMIAALPKQAKIGTSSLRRAAQLKFQRPDLQIVEHRGNVPTRLQKLAESKDLHAIVLAAAGLERLGLQNEFQRCFAAEELLPAVNQGTLVAQFRKADTDVRELLGQLVDPKTAAGWQAERAVIEVLQADCSSAVAVYANGVENELRLAAAVYAKDGSERLAVSGSGAQADASELGVALGKELLARGAAKLL